MPTVVTKGIVLHVANFRDNDRMLTLLTPGYGCLDVLARGCRRPKSPLLPCCEWFAYGEYTLFVGRESAIVNSGVLEDHFYPLRLDNYRLTCAAYIAALCRETAAAGTENADVFALLLKGLYYLSYEPGADALGTTAAFILLFMDIAGYRPRLTRCVHCGTPLNLEGDSYLDVQAGGLCCPACTAKSAFRLSHEQVVWISRTLREKKLLQQAAVEKPFFTALKEYAQCRLDGGIKAGKLLP